MEISSAFFSPSVVLKHVVLVVSVMCEDSFYHVGVDSYFLLISSPGCDSDLAWTQPGSSLLSFNLYSVVFVACFARSLMCGVHARLTA